MNIETVTDSTTSTTISRSRPLAPIQSYSSSSQPNNQTISPSLYTSTTSKMASLHGILVALITPFTDDKTAIDESRLQAHIEHLITAGVHGLVPGGSTGEFTTLTVAERKQLTELCVKFAAGRVPVVAGTGSLSSAEAVELSVHAAQVGAAATMVVPPYYDPVSLPELHELLGEIPHCLRSADRLL
jgi:Dihydrodipicolinate synthase/N-acetylneuraminate lyase